MKLILVRHAAAGVRDIHKWPNDGDRPLTKKGRRRFEAAAAGIALLEPDVDVVLASLKVRAWDTAQILHEEAGWPAPQACHALGGSAIREVIEELRSYQELDTVAVVGHEPYLSALASALLAPGADIAIELKKGAAMCLEIDGLSEAGGKLLWLLQPKMLRALG